MAGGVSNNGSGFSSEFLNELDMILFGNVSGGGTASEPSALENTQNVDTRVNDVFINTFEQLPQSALIPPPEITSSSFANAPTLSAANWTALQEEDTFPPSRVFHEFTGSSLSPRLQAAPSLPLIGLDSLLEPNASNEIENFVDDYLLSLEPVQEPENTFMAIDPPLLSLEPSSSELPPEAEIPDLYGLVARPWSPIPNPFERFATTASTSAFSHSAGRLQTPDSDDMDALDAQSQSLVWFEEECKRLNESLKKKSLKPKETKKQRHEIRDQIKNLMISSFNRLQAIVPLSEDQKDRLIKIYRDAYDIYPHSTHHNAVPFISIFERNSLKAILGEEKFHELISHFEFIEELQAPLPSTSPEVSDPEPITVPAPRTKKSRTIAPHGSTIYDFDFEENCLKIEKRVKGIVQESEKQFSNVNKIRDRIKLLVKNGFKEFKNYCPLSEVHQERLLGLLRNLHDIYPTVGKSVVLLSSYYPQELLIHLLGEEKFNQFILTVSNNEVCFENASSSASRSRLAASSSSKNEREPIPSSKSFEFSNEREKLSNFLGSFESERNRNGEFLVSVLNRILNGFFKKISTFKQYLPLTDRQNDLLYGLCSKAADLYFSSKKSDLNLFVEKCCESRLADILGPERFNRFIASLPAGAQSSSSSFSESKS